MKLIDDDWSYNHKTNALILDFAIQEGERKITWNSIFLE